MKQSSIEWLIEEFYNCGFKHIYDADEIINQAKEMHKQEVIDARVSKVSLFNEIEKQEQSNEAEQYYNETYNIKR